MTDGKELALPGSARAVWASFEMGLQRAVTTERARTQPDDTALVADKPAVATTPDRDRMSAVWVRVIDAIRQPLLVLDASLCVLFANRAFYRRFNVAPAQTVGHHLSAVGKRCLDAPALAEFVAQIQ